MKKFLTTVLTAVMVLSTAAGCSKDSFKYDDTYKTIFSQEIYGLNYLWSEYQVDSLVFTNFVDGLVENDPYGNIVGALATDWSSNDDATVWTFDIRKDVKWQNWDGSDSGKVVTAHDWVTSAKYILDPANESGTAWLYTDFIKGAEDFYNGKVSWDEVGIKAVDDYTLEYTTTRGMKYFPSVLTYSPYLPANADYLAEVGDKFGTDKDKILYNGCYLLSEWVKDASKVYVKNEGYWDADNVHIDRIELSKVTDPAQALEMYLRGELTSSTINTTQYKDMIAKDEYKDLVYQSETDASVYFFMFNQNHEGGNKDWNTAVQNINFRKALYHGFDRIPMLTVRNSEKPETLKRNTLVKPQFITTPDGKEYTQIGGLKEYSDNDNYDLDLAKEYLEKAKTELGSSVSWPITIDYVSIAGIDMYSQFALYNKQMMEDNLGKENVSINVIEVTSKEWQKSARVAGKWSMYFSGWGPDYRDPESYLSIFSTGGSIAEDMGLSDSKFDDLYSKAQDLVEENARFEAFAEAETYLLDQAYIIPLFAAGGGFAINKLKPFSFPYAGYGIAADKLKYGSVLLESVSAEKRADMRAEWIDKMGDSAK